MQLSRISRISRQVTRHTAPWGLFLLVLMALVYASVYWTTFSDALLSYRAHQVPPYASLPYNVKFDNETTLEYMKEKRAVIKSDIQNILLIVGKQFGVRVAENPHLKLKAKLPISAELDKLNFSSQDSSATGSEATGTLSIIRENLREAMNSWGLMLTVKIVRRDDINGKQQRMVLDDNGKLVPYDKTDRILRWSREIQLTSRKYNIDPAIIAAIIEQESGGNPEAGSSAGAQGLMQLMPRTARGLGVNPWNPLQNIDGGTRYFLYQYKRFGNFEQALAAYNAGPGNVINGNYLYIAETQRYIRNVPVLVNKYQRLFAKANSHK